MENSSRISNHHSIWELTSLSPFGLWHLYYKRDRTNKFGVCSEHRLRIVPNAGFLNISIVFQLIEGDVDGMCI